MTQRLSEKLSETFVSSLPNECVDGIDSKTDSEAVAETEGNSAESSLKPEGMFSETESAMVFDCEETLTQRQQLAAAEYSDGSSMSTQDAGGFLEDSDLHDRRLLVEPISRLSVSSISCADTDMFHCTLPVTGRHVLDPEAKGINAASRKQQRMIMCNSDCSTLSSTDTTNRPASRDVGGNTCGCFRLFRLPVAVKRATPPVRDVDAPVTAGGRSAQSRKITGLKHKNDAKSVLSVITHGRRTSNSGCVNPPSAVQTFSFADTKIGNAVSAVSGTDGGLVVRVKSCRGGQHHIDNSSSESTSTTAINSAGGVRKTTELNLLVGGRKNSQKVRRWRVARSTGLGSDSTGNFTLVPRRCTEVGRAMGYSRKRWQRVTQQQQQLSDSRLSGSQLNGRTSDHIIGQEPHINQSEHRGVPVATKIKRSQNFKQPRSVGRQENATKATINTAFSGAASAVWRRLVAGFEVAADDGRKLFANCRLVGDDVGTGRLALTACKSYDLL